MAGVQNFITREDIIAYAEEGGDFAQLKEVDAFMEVRGCDSIISWRCESV